MTLPAGTRLGPYEIVSPLGAGGMGEVYKARDTRLEREVAVKVLPDQLSGSPEFQQRFEREAKAVSQLSHPHICALYDVGRQDGTEYLVMELLEGQVLSDRLARGPLPREQVLEFGKQIADALDAAHRRSLVHRDLKPGNVMITRSGVKLLDFGLAKAIGPRAEEADLTSLPTEAERPLTERGTILGTFQYMAPEQLEGRPADARTDIFALGCVLYEMATGKKAFSGASRASLISSIMSSEPPPISSIHAMTPPALDRIVRTCLAKDPDERWQSARDVKSELAWIAEAGSQAGAPAVVAAHRKNRERIAWTLASLAGVAFLATLAILWRVSRKTPAAPAELSLEIPSLQTLITLAGPGAVISPDGSRIAYVANAEGKSQIFVRELGKPQAIALKGATGLSPFFSPDGQWIGFFGRGNLEKVSVFGGAPVTLCDAAGSRGASWGKDDTIVFTPGLTSPLERVPAGGGAPKPVTNLDAGRRAVTHRWPEMLPGDEAVIFTASANNNDFTHADIEAASLSSGRRKVLIENAYFGRYLAPGYLAYVSGGTLFAVPFDARRLEVTGTSMPVVQDILADLTNGSAQFSSSETGTAVYMTGKTIASQVTVALLDRKGTASPLVEQPDDYYAPRFSPDGKQLSLQVGVGNTWIFDLARKTMTPLTFPPSACLYPVWSPDGQNIVCQQANPAAGGITLSEIPSDGTGSLHPLTERATLPQVPSSWSPDGRTLAFFQFRPRGTSCCDLWALPVRPDGKSDKARPLLGQESDSTFTYPAFSPDGRWLAYTSNESGEGQVYVIPYPGPGGKRQISNAGGRLARWSRTGQELFFEQLSNPSAIVSVRYRVQGDSFIPGAPEVLFQGHFEARAPYPDFDLAPDDEHFAMLEPA